MTSRDREISYATAAGCRAYLEGQDFDDQGPRSKYPSAFRIGYDWMLEETPDLAGLLGKILDRRQRDIEGRLAQIESCPGVEGDI